MIRKNIRLKKIQECVDTLFKASMKLVEPIHKNNKSFFLLRWPSKIKFIQQCSKLSLSLCFIFHLHFNDRQKMLIEVAIIMSEKLKALLQIHKIFLEII